MITDIYDLNDMTEYTTKVIFHNFLVTDFFRPLFLFFTLEILHAGCHLPT
jgi:hypothetical protein